jgi:hypothetical protein
MQSIAVESVGAVCAVWVAPRTVDLGPLGGEAQVDRQAHLRLDRRLLARVQHVVAHRRVIARSCPPHFGAADEHRDLGHGRALRPTKNIERQRGQSPTARNGQRATHSAQQSHSHTRVQPTASQTRAADSKSHRTTHARRGYDEAVLGATRQPARSIQGRAAGSPRTQSRPRRGKRGAVSGRASQRVRTGSRLRKVTVPTSCPSAANVHLP